ncbi:NAD(P)H-quinone oxidoreductase subunit S, chloroplastic [Silene latifolia]|uniref:NAD(P)H-quinone oxidoreductase subunit S, chloroplastic n=1 Tax=Silene latifolia TaxID=37657 RepID=UPI003D76D663
MASSSISPSTIRAPIHHKSQFLGQNNIKLLTRRSFASTCNKGIKYKPTVSAKFDLFQILGGRGLCNGEAGLLEELKKDTQIQPQTSDGNEEAQPGDTENKSSKLGGISEDAFEKEMLGLTGGFPGGEKGLREFLEKNPPPPPKKGEEDDQLKSVLGSTKKPKTPELPMLLPGMIAIVKNKKNPFYMYCGIVQRITDGKAGVLFEGGNWDRLVTFRLEELERREKGPPMVNPKSVVLEPMIEMLKQQEMLNKQ